MIKKKLNFCPDSTQTHLRDPKKGSNVTQLNSLENFRLLAQKFQITLRSCSELSGNEEFFSFY